jgi:hypothetical protein
MVRQASCQAVLSVDMETQGEIPVSMNFSAYEHLISATILRGLRDYVEKRVPTGGFLRAVLESDLFGALGKADLSNRAAIYPICELIYNELPAPCFGSKERVAAWLKGGKDPK